MVPCSTEFEYNWAGGFYAFSYSNNLQNKNSLLVSEIRVAWQCRNFAFNSNILFAFEIPWQISIAERNEKITIYNPEEIKA